MSDMKTSIFNRFGKFFGLGAPKPRGEIRFVDYREGDRLIRTGEWKLAIPEEDRNSVFNRVYVEKKEKGNE